MLTFVFLISLLTFSSASFYFPSPLTSRLEHILVDTDGAFRSGFKDAITPCTNYVSGSQNFGRQTSAQWLRVAFHDFVTAHVDEGTGGLDASISMETLRDEDSGTAFNDTFSFFRPYIDARTSASDLLAVSVVLSLSNCGGLMVPFRPGRIDAHEPGPFGVPAPENNLTETLQFFANSGFNASDAIGLTACGHSLGRVHHGGFPQVVPESAVTPNNTAGGIDLDTTRAKFDINVVREYLGGYGQRGGPLVTSDNVTVRSDLRLYESDGNATMKSLGQSEEKFSNVCRGLFERMINTVPKQVMLGDVIEPVSTKAVNVSFNLNDRGKLGLSGLIRILTKSSSPPPLTINVAVPNAAKEISALPETGYSIYGNTTFFPFSFTIEEPSPSQVINLTVSGKDISGMTFALNPTLFLVPSMTTISHDNTLIITAAALSQAPPASQNSVIRANISYPITQSGLDTLVPSIKTEETYLVFWRSLGAYQLFNGYWAAPDIANVNWTSTSVDIGGWIDGAWETDEYTRLDYLVEGQ